MAKLKSTDHRPLMSHRRGQRAAMNVGLPDHEAQQLWDRVADTSTGVADAVDNIARLTVCGEQTREELRQAADLLEQTVSILERTSAREGRLFTERARLLGDDQDGCNRKVRS